MNAAFGKARRMFAASWSYWLRWASSVITIISSRSDSTGIGSPRSVENLWINVKTQGTCLYASMQADLNAQRTEDFKPVGIVIITRLIEDADGIARQINELSGRTVAVSHHSKNKADTIEMFNRDVLV